MKKQDIKNMILKRECKKNIVVLISVLLVFSFAVIPVIEANNNISRIEKSFIERNGFLGKLFEKIYTLLNKFGFDLTKTNRHNIQRLGMLQEDELIISHAKKFFANSTVQQKLNDNKNEIDLMIQSFDVNNTDLFKTFINYNEVFDISNVFDRISSLKIGSVKNQVLNMIGNYEPNSYKSFDDTYNISMENLLRVLYDNDKLDNPEYYYPMVDQICEIITLFTLALCIPMVFLLGLNGLFIGLMISMIFWGPIIIPMSVYVSFCEVVTNNSEVQEYLMNILVGWGIIGLITLGVPYMLKILFDDGYFLIGLAYVLCRVLLYADNGMTSEVFPSAYIEDKITVYYAKDIVIPMTVKDWDLINNVRHRDYIRIGWAYENDSDRFGITWSDFVYYHGQHINFNIGFKYTGIFHDGIYVILQDNFGGMSDWYKINFDVKFDRGIYS